MRRALRRALKLLARPPLLGLWLLSGFGRRDPRRWVFGSWYGRRFADNSKWLFLHLVAARPAGVDVTWISADRRLVASLRAAGLPAAHGWSLRGIRAQLAAGVCVFDVYTNDLNYWFTRGAKLVNLWHGIPLKRIERDIENPEHFIRRGTGGSALQRLAFRLGFPWMANRFDLMPASSPRCAALLAGAFGLPAERVAVTGFPRNDAILAAAPPGPWDAEAHAALSRLKADGRRLVAYLPTFRDRDARRGTAAPLPIDWPALDAFCAARNLAVVVKLHGNDVLRLPDLSALPRLVALPAAADLYPLLGLFDVLVTDYSSIYFDYLLLDRPIVFFNFDQADYEAHSRSFYSDYDALTPGEKAPDFPRLLAALERALAEDAPDPRRREAIALWHSHRDADAAGRLAAEILRRFAPEARA